MNVDELLYRLGLDRRRWRSDLRETKREEEAHLETCRHLRIRLAEPPVADKPAEESS